ncbi:hypothetical protein GCM10011515_03250 [Tsuneonella deserti]|uniref:Uncharacterized protein n=2 Tax=Tsuneonella deserti TaxID=2035528 RepID=A0ABQ1S153_9SPHN|nr:hypothetical protein GCM10011515_03250 [Tsuneonella deserti]
MLTCLGTLVKGNALSEKQRAVFIDNIRIRLGKTDFDWQGPIKLTRTQMPAARDLLAQHAGAASSRGVDAGIEQDLMDEVAALKARVVDLERILNEMLRTFDDGSASMLPSSYTLPAETALEAAESAGSRSLTKRNGTKRNHGADMTCPSGAIDPMNIAMPSAPANDVLPSTSDMGNKSHDKSARRPSSNRAVVSYFRNDPQRPPSAVLEFDGERYSLVFNTADTSEDKMRTTFSNEWLCQFEATIGKTMRAQSRSNSASDKRYVMSPLYSARDCYGIRQPVLPDCVAILVWADDCTPEAVIVLVDDSDLTISLNPVTQTKPKGPTHKGSVRLAA